LKGELTIKQDRGTVIHITFHIYDKGAPNA
jgi:hypothetical protein